MINKNLTRIVLKQKFSSILWYFLFNLKMLLFNTRSGQIKNARKTVSLLGRLPYIPPRSTKQTYSRYLFFYLKLIVKKNDMAMHWLTRVVVDYSIYSMGMRMEVPCRCQMYQTSHTKWARKALNLILSRIYRLSLSQHFSLLVSL